MDRYGGRQNPFDDRGATDGGYGGPQQSYGQSYGGNQYSDNQYGGSNVEMTSLSGGGYGGGAASNPNAILNECRSIDQGIDEVENNLGQLRMLQDRSLSDADTSGNSATKRQLEGLSNETMDMYRALVERVRTVKSNPDSQSSKNSPQVGRIDRRLKTVIQQYQQVESQFRKKTQDQMARQYRIVRPEAGEDEVRQAVSDPDGGAVFSQALMQSSRQGQARAALNAVQDRHAEIQRIERQMVELAQMFQDMDTIVVQQQEAVAQIEQKGEEVAENLIKGNEEIEVAVNTARSTRKKKWWCLAICVAIIIIVAIVVVVVVAVNGGFKGSSPAPAAAPAPAPAVPTANARRALDNAAAAMNLDSNTISRVLRDRMNRPGVEWQPGAHAARADDAATYARNMAAPF
ncbi:t-SNARE [Plectosphaerella plurivora]|uniref:t-SNARE n=1 Tax=Plectosphaerella plurivora TaxID=936078 RepID=A0A9P8V581_9PEZI|nr:t-SNARE [Plectosphaerella plurivora]